MSLNPNFTIGQNPLQPNIVVANDTSTGSDVAITQRRIFVQDTQNNYLVPAGTTTQYTQWAIGSGTISLNILTKDIAASITVQWLDINNTVLYTLTYQFCFPLFTKQFLYYLVQLQGLTPTIPIDTNYNANIAILWSNILGAMNAVTINSDIFASQAALNRAYTMIVNQSKYF